MGHGLRDLEIQAQACVQLRLATTGALPEVRQHLATSELRSVFAGYVCTLCSLRMDCSCVQIEHACPTLYWKLWSSL